MNQEVMALLADADKVLIGIGESFERKDVQFSTEAFCMLEKENPLLAGFERLEYWKNNPKTDAIEAYNRLFDLVGEKDYFVVTTCTDDRIYESRFSKDRITAPCGTWKYLQCSDLCTEELLPVTEEMVQNFIIIGRTDKMTYRQTHLHGIPAGKDVAEVACGHGKVQFFACFDLTQFHCIQICPEIVNDLGHQSADIDGVCRGELEPFFIQFFF